MKLIKRRESCGFYMVVYLISDGGKWTPVSPFAPGSRYVAVGLAVQRTGACLG